MPGILHTKRPKVEPETTEVHRPHDVSQVGNDERPRCRAVRSRDLDGLQPFRSAFGHALLKKGVPEGAVGKPLQHRWPAARDAKDRFLNCEVVVDEIELARPETGKKHFAGVRDLDAAARHFDCLAGGLALRARHADRITGPSRPPASCIRSGRVGGALSFLSREVDDVADYESHDEHYHHAVQQSDRPAPTVVGKPETPDPAYVEHEGDDAYREPDGRPCSGGRPEHRREDREHDIAEQAPEPGKHYRSAEDAVRRSIVGRGRAFRDAEKAAHGQVRGRSSAARRAPPPAPSWNGSPARDYAQEEHISSRQRSGPPFEATRSRPQLRDWRLW